MEPGSERRESSDVPRAPGNPTGLERVLLGLLIALGALARVVAVDAPLDRHFDGFQGAFFTVCAVNYERLADARAEAGEPSDGLLPAGAGSGYPVVNLDLDVDAPDGWYLYANHPPTVAWLAWAGLRAFGPEGWDRAWREGRAPRDFEGALRAPFLALHLVGLAALFLALRVAGCRRAAWYATTLYAVAPAAILFAGLVNYENPSVPFALLGAAAALRYLRGGSAVWLAAVALAFAGAGAVTYAPIFTAGAVAAAAFTLSVRRAALVGVAAIGGTLAPLAVHGAAAGALLEAHGVAAGSLSDRVRTMIAPLLDGETPLSAWLGVQARLLTSEVGFTALALAAVGLVVAVGRVTRGNRTAADTPLAGTPRADTGSAPAAASVDRAPLLALALAVGGAAMQFAFYRHTRDPQDPFILHLIPGLAALGGVALARLASARAEVGVAAALGLVVLASLESGLRTLELHLRWRGEGPAPGEATGVPPFLPTPDVLGAALADVVPPGDVAWYPAALGLNPATGLYGWRTLLPVTPGGYPLTQLAQNELGLEAATTWLIVPVHLPRPARAAAATLLADLEVALPGTIDAPAAQNEHWRAWRLRN